MVLDRRRAIEIRKCARGDLPDWVAAPSSLRELTVAEAKGSHDSSGPAKALKRAWKQAGRVDILSGGRRATVKRMAIVTRWGVRRDGPREPWISVRDPIDEGDAMEPDEKDAIFIGLFRHHAANMIARLGHPELAASLRVLATAGTEQDERQAAQQARHLLEVDSAESFNRITDHPRMDDLIGGTVTGTGMLGGITVLQADWQALARLDLRPVFVSIHRTVIRGLIDGDPSLVEQALMESRFALPRPARIDRVGDWIIPLGDEAEAYTVGS